jgi:ribose 5-phosphate isomerase B
LLFEERIMMIIAIGSDHRGLALKNSLKNWLLSNGNEVKDFGTDNATSVDYPDYAFAVAETVAKGDAELGILICGTGIGMSIAANKVRGVRAARICTTKDAELSKRHNNANVICLGADTIDEALAQKMISMWMETLFEGGRHERRVEKISTHENGFSKNNC